MKHAVLITAYKNLQHLNNIISYLKNDDFLFFIHIDKKSQINEKELNKLSEFSNVKTISRKYSVNWGGMNHLNAILLLLKESYLKYPDINYFHVITGHDYPIKSPKQVNLFFEKNRAKGFIEFNKLPYEKWKNGGMERLIYYNLYDILNGKSKFQLFFIRLLIHLQKLIGFKRSFPKDFPRELYGGSTYWTLHRDSVRYIFEYLDEHSSYLKRFRYTFCSEEIFFQTILLNSPFKNDIINDNLRFIVWEERNGNYPANLDETDYNQISTSTALFARKFEFPVSENLLRKINSELLN